MVTFKACWPQETRWQFQVYALNKREVHGRQPGNGGKRRMGLATPARRSRQRRCRDKDDAVAQPTARPGYLTAEIARDTNVRIGTIGGVLLLVEPARWIRPALR